MSYLEIALANARKGYPIFPAMPITKVPKSGFSDWEQNATTDQDQIRSWWAENDEWLPAVTPGRVGLAVVDVDQHEGKDNGFVSLEKYKVFLPDTFNRPSVSGNGLHYWYRGEVGSRNGVIPGVDRKAQGGYIVAVYELPEISEIIQPIPERLSGSASESVDRNRKSRMQLNEWIREVGDGEPDDVMWKLLENYIPSGNEHMSKYVARVVSQAALGHPGGSYVLDRMMERWLDVTHFSGEPEEEFMVNVRSAIEKFGEPVPELSMSEKMANLLNPGFQLSLTALEETIQGLRIFCDSKFPGWEQEHLRDVNDLLSRLGIYLNKVKSEEDYYAVRMAFKQKLKEMLSGKSN